jgi:hypothetical protein
LIKRLLALPAEEETGRKLLCFFVLSFSAEKGRTFFLEKSNGGELNAERKRIRAEESIR